MWHFVSEQISEATGSLFVCQKRTAINGGDINDCYVISDDTKRYFVKTHASNASSGFNSEVHSLNVLAHVNHFKVPKVICHGQTVSNGEPIDYLVLSYLKLVDGDTTDWAALGTSLAMMHHDHVSPRFGWEQDNYLGTTQQNNKWCEDWCSFFVFNRIEHLLVALSQSGIVLSHHPQLVNKIAQMLEDHQPTPSLVHGDLWKGNVGFSRHCPAIFDPACYYGDRETDIAMTELFGTFPAEFYRAYQQTASLDDGYAQRKIVYQFYHVLNHALMFRDSYKDMAESLAKQIYHA